MPSNGLRYKFIRADSDNEVSRLKDGQYGEHGCGVSGGGHTGRRSAVGGGTAMGRRRRALAFPGRGGVEGRRRASDRRPVKLNTLK